MEHTKNVVKRWLLPVVLVGALGGCAVQQTTPIASGYYIVNPDGSRTFVQGSYACPRGYTCYSDASPVYSPSYTTTYVEPSPYIWTPIFFSLGYFFGYHSHGPRYHGGPPHHGGPYGPRR